MNGKTVNRALMVTVLVPLIAMSFFLSPSGLDAAPKVAVTDIRYWSYPNYTRLVVELSDQSEFAEHRLSNPDRLFFDIKGGRLSGSLQKHISIENGMLKAVRTGQFNEDTVRIVLDLEKIEDFKVFSLEDPNRIVIDVYGKTVFSAKKRVVIDPGHGGHDPGAVGPNKLYEKDVVLDIALKLRNILSQDPNYEIHMTRDKDVFVPLEERAAIANSKHADLFVSIHANASPRRNAKGIETYFLNWTNDEEAMKVAARENQISLKQMKNMQGKRDVLDIMLGDLSRDVKRDKSLTLANYIQRSMVTELNRDYRHIVDLGVKQALFYVLLGAQMSSVLVEVSFISNPLEEKLLAMEDYRHDLAKSIAAGISKYVSSPMETQTVAGISHSIDSRD